MIESIKKKISDLGNGIKSFFIAMGTIITAIAALSAYIFFKEKHFTIIVVTTKKQGKCKFDSYLRHEQNQSFINSFIL